MRALSNLVVNEDEGAWLRDHLCGAGDGDARALHRRLGVAVVRTLGSQGVGWARNGVRHHLAGHAVDARDATAVGDCFVGVLAAATAARCDRRANAAAALHTPTPIAWPTSGVSS